MSQRFVARFAVALAGSVCLAGCAGGGGAIQPDRSVFSLDGNYQRCQFGYGIEDTFDRTVKVFKEAGYHLDVTDRATGQISGERPKGNGSDKGLKFYALILPTQSGQSQVGVKIVQIIEHGAVFSNSRTELIVSDPQMYQYLFRRIADIDNGVPPAATAPASASSAPRSGYDAYGQSSYPQQQKGYGAP